MISLVFQGTPISKLRPRFRIFRGHVMTYTPKKTKNAEKAVIAQLKEQYNGPALEGTLAIMIDFYMPIPKYISKKKQKELPGKPYDKKPDIDNLTKTYLDAMNGIVFKDDRQIAQLYSSKVYSINPRVQISLTEI